MEGLQRALGMGTAGSVGKLGRGWGFTVGCEGTGGFGQAGG